MGTMRAEFTGVDSPSSPGILQTRANCPMKLVVANQLIEHRAGHATCIHIALPVVAGDDAALAELIATG